MIPSSARRTLVSAGELRTSLLELFEDEPESDILCAAPGLFAMPPAAHATIARQPHPRSAEFEYRQVLLQAFGRDLDHLPQTPEWEQRILKWSRRLASREGRVLHYSRSPLFTRLISRSEASVVPSAPLTVEMAQQKEKELCLHLTGQPHLDARAWFERHAANAEDISDDVQELLAGCWAGKLLSANDLYYKILAEYFHEILASRPDGSDDNPMLEVMTEFQQAAYQYAKGILRRFGGVLLADVVGLGKTYIAMALLRRFWREGVEKQAVELSELEGLDLFHRHGQGADEPNADKAAVASARLGELVEAARGRFAIEAGRIRLQRAQPALDKTEEWLRSELDKYLQTCDVSREGQVTRAIDWVLAGQHKTQLRPAANRWRKEGLSGEALLQAMRNVMRRSPLREELLGEEEMVGGVIGASGKPPRSDMSE